MEKNCVSINEIQKEIERLTTMNVQEVSVMAKGIHMPDSIAKR